MTLLFRSVRDSGNPISMKIREEDMVIKVLSTQEIVKFKIIKREPTLLRVKIQMEFHDPAIISQGIVRRLFS